MEYTNNKQIFAAPFTFLVVDDHDFMHRLIKETLFSAEAGKVEKALNGEDAIRTLKKLKKVDFVITDFNMPKMNGLQLLKTIRMGDAYIDRETPVIMLSGFDDEVLLSAALDLDASGFVQKPVSKIDLVSRMNNIFMGETTIKEIDEYKAIVLPVIEDAFQTTNPVTSLDSPIIIPDEIKAGAQLVPLEEVVVGSMLVEDAVTGTGVVLIVAGGQLSQKILNFLIQTKDITQITTLVVRKL